MRNRTAEIERRRRRVVELQAELREAIDEWDALEKREEARRRRSFFGRAERLRVKASGAAMAEERDRYQNAAETLAEMTGNSGLLLSILRGDV